MDKPKKRRQGIRHEGNIKFKLPFERLELLDYVKIFFYHMIEPFLGASSLAVCLQIPSLTTGVYILLLLLTLLPFTLTSHTTRIQFKICLTVVMLLIAVAFTTLKSYVCYLTSGISTTKNDDHVIDTLGIIEGKPVESLFIDITMIITTILLFLHLLNQKKQSKERVNMT